MSLFKDFENIQHINLIATMSASGVLIGSIIGVTNGDAGKGTMIEIPRNGWRYVSDEVMKRHPDGMLFGHKITPVKTDEATMGFDITTPGGKVFKVRLNYESSAVFEGTTFDQYVITHHYN